MIMDFPQTIPRKVNEFLLFPSGLHLERCAPLCETPVAGYADYISKKSKNIPIGSLHLIDCPAPNVIVWVLQNADHKLVYVGVPSGSVFRAFVDNDGTFWPSVGIYKK